MTEETHENPEVTYPLSQTEFRLNVSAMCRITSLPVLLVYMDEFRIYVLLNFRGTLCLEGNFSENL